MRAHPTDFLNAKDKWLATLVDEAGPHLLRFLASRLADASQAEDLAQEVYLRLLRVDDVGLIRDPRAFALRVAANVAHEWRMLARNRLAHSADALETLIDKAEEPFDTVAQAEQLARLRAALNTLSPTCRAVLLLHRRDGLTYHEIATHVGLSVGMVKKHLARGLATCQQFLKERSGTA